MGRLSLQWFPIELQMVNQQKNFPMGRLQGVTIDIKGASTQMDFEVIEIVDDNNPYPMLLGVDWAIEMNGVINLNKHKMIFEKNSLRVVVLLDPPKGVRYIVPVCDNDSDDDLDFIYMITMQEEDWVNPTADGRISWEHEISYSSDLDEEIEQW